MTLFYYLLIAWLMATFMALFSLTMKDSPLKQYGWSIWFIITIIVIGSISSSFIK